MTISLNLITKIALVNTAVSESNDPTLLDTMNAAAQLAATTAGAATAANPTNLLAAATAIEAGEAAIATGIVVLARDCRKNNRNIGELTADVVSIIGNFSIVAGSIVGIVPTPEAIKWAEFLKVLGTATTFADLALTAPDNLNILFNNLSMLVEANAQSLGISTNMAQVVNWFNQTPARVDPIILDLNGDGVKLTSLTTSDAYFDLYGTGVAQKTGWIDSSDGFLVVDKNNNGVIDNINEMFGNASTNGFTALKAIDSNNDNIINASDATFSTLRVWQDANGNGITDAGELKTLAQLGISAINQQNLRGSYVFS